MAQMIKNTHAKHEIQVQFLDWKDPMKRKVAIHSKHACLGYSMDRGAWWDSVHGVTIKSRHKKKKKSRHDLASKQQ